jgi:hypothetical protein
MNVSEAQWAAAARELQNANARIPSVKSGGGRRGSPSGAVLLGRHAGC